MASHIIRPRQPWWLLSRSHASTFTTNLDNLIISFRKAIPCYARITSYNFPIPSNLPCFFWKCFRQEYAQNNGIPHLSIELKMKRKINTLEEMKTMHVRWLEIYASASALYNRASLWEGWSRAQLITDCGPHNVLLSRGCQGRRHLKAK